MSKMMPIEVIIQGGMIRSKCHLVNEIEGEEQENHIVNNPLRPIYMKPIPVTERLQEKAARKLEEFYGINKREPDEVERQSIYSSLESEDKLYQALSALMKAYAEEMTEETGIEFDGTI